MGKIEQNKEKKKNAILLAAQDVFLSEGYVLASVDKIAAQARVTKQTIYRYFPSKSELFKATLEHMGEHFDAEYLVHLQEPDAKEALYKFAVGFIQAHLSREHLATYRLLVVESAKAPEIVRAFYAVGSDDLDAKLSEFFAKRLGLKNVETTVQLWMAMLLAHRASILTGMEIPNDRQIEKHAIDATDFLLAAIHYR